MSANGANAGRSPRYARFSCGAVDLARDLLGQRLVRVDDLGRRRAGIVVETEAYVGPCDRAAHSAGGRRTARNRSMYLSAGHAYVYFVYGMHWCFNVVAAGSEGAEAVLIRAIRPTEGLDQMAALRGSDEVRMLCSGPARLTQALGIDRAHDGLDLRCHPHLFLELESDTALPTLATTRIGVGYAGEWADRPWRFLLGGADMWWSRPVVKERRTRVGP